VDAVAKENRLDRGEAEAIVLYREQDARLLLVDERRAVQYARRSGLQVVRTPMICATAKKRGLVADFSERLDSLRRAGFWLKDEDYATITRELGGG
jgi:predicted nucleic acid-binding protein